MPKDSSATRYRLLVAAEELFADRGVWQVPTADIVALAEQRNASALTYHFGSRERVLEAILVEHGDPIDERRGELLAQVAGEPELDEWVTILVDAIADSLETERGRRYLRIVDQLSHLTFSAAPSVETMPPFLTTAIAGIRTAISPGVPEHLLGERVKAMVMLMTASLADRARHIDRRRGGRSTGALDASDYRVNLTAMLSGVLSAPVPSASLVSARG